MIRDLQGAGEQAATADVLVVGAGTCGLLMAVELARKGLRVVCLESGGLVQEADEHPLNEVVHRRSVYGGAAHGRYRCLGGTSTRWGGALIPFAEADLDGGDWPIQHAEILHYRPAVERLFGLPDGSYDLDDLLGAGQSRHKARLAKWPPFPKRNVASLLAQEARTLEGLEIWLNATATDFRTAGGRLTETTARALDGSILRARFRHAVIAAGAIESTRLLLLLDQQNGGVLSDGHDQLGRYFHDHLSVIVAHLEDVDRRALNELVGFRFEPGGVMRNLRFELAEASVLRGVVPPCFAHIAFESEPGGGFDSLRELLRRLQQGRLPERRTLLRLARSTPWLLRAVWWRAVKKRLLYPRGARIELHMVIEQAPAPDNRISLSPDAKDAFGQPLAEVSWAPSDLDGANLLRAADAFQTTWETSPLGRLARLARRPPDQVLGELARGSGIYHPGGSTRMARSPECGVVDPDLRLFRLANVSVVATSVFPTGGGANPTMMLMMLAFRCVAQLERQLGAAGGLSCEPGPSPPTGRPKRVPLSTSVP